MSDPADSASAIAALNDMIQQHSPDGVIDFNSDESDALFEAVARYANNNKPLPETPEEIEKMLQSMPLTATHMPAPGEESNAFKAMQAIIDDVPVEKRMYNYKESGNRAYKLALRMTEPRPDETPADKGRRMTTRKAKLEEAIAFYTQALAVAPPEKDVESELKATIYNNRAQCHLGLENYGYTVRDCQKAISFNAALPKAFYRASTALFKLHKFAPAFVMCRQGLQRVERGSAEQKQLIALARQIVPVWKRADDAERARLAKRKAEAEEKAAREAKLAAVLKKRGVTIGEAQFRESAGQYDAKPYVDEKNAVHWPVTFLYPEASQSDYFADVSENATINDLLKQLFPPLGASPPWDAAGEYVCGKIEVYVMLGAAESILEDSLRVDADKGTKVTIPAASTIDHALGALSKKGYIVPGVPTFCIKPKRA